MKPLSFEVAFPTIYTDIDKWKSDVEKTGSVPDMNTTGWKQHIDITRWYVLQLLNKGSLAEAKEQMNAIDHDAIRYTLTGTWYSLVYMTLAISDGDYKKALALAEATLQDLYSIIIDKSDIDYIAIVATVIYNLALVHHNMGEDSRAEKELVKAQKLFDKLAKKDKTRFGSAIINAIEASTSIFNSRLKQMNILAHYQVATEMYLNKAHRGTSLAIADLVNSLKDEGDLHLKIGNYRDAVRYYTKALRYQKKVTNKMGMTELRISIGLGKALLNISNRRDKGEQLLSSLISLAQKLDAPNEVDEINELLATPASHFDFMESIKKLFSNSIIPSSAIAAPAQFLVGHRGSIWGVENSTEAFTRGAEAGFQALECDLRTTKDGKLIVFHDDNMRRLSGGECTDSIDDMTLAQIQEIELKQKRRDGKSYTGKVCLLDEYLDICNNYGVIPVIDIKWCSNIYSSNKSSYQFCFDGIPALMQAIKDKGAMDKVILISSMKGVLTHIRENYSDIQLQLVSPTNWRANLEWCKEHNISIDVENGSDINAPLLVELFHNEGLKVNVWTVDDNKSFLSLQAAGVDMITTNKITHKSE